MFIMYGYSVNYMSVQFLETIRTSVLVLLYALPYKFQLQVFKYFSDQL